MDEFPTELTPLVTELSTLILGGGSGVIAILLLVVGALLWERRMLVARTRDLESRLDEVERKLVALTTENALLKARFPLFRSGSESNG